MSLAYLCSPTSTCIFDCMLQLCFAFIPRSYAQNHVAGIKSLFEGCKEPASSGKIKETVEDSS